MGPDESPRGRRRDGISLTERSRAKAGDGFEFVERTARRAEPAAGNHRHLQAAAGQQGSEDQRALVADASGRMLVNAAGKVFAGENFPRAQHLFRERGRFRLVHSPPINGHRQGRHLIVGNTAAGVTLNKLGNFRRRERASIPFTSDDLAWTEDVHLLRFNETKGFCDRTGYGLSARVFGVFRAGFYPFFRHT